MNIFKLFSRSPFEPLNELLKKVEGCVSLMKPMLEANFAEDYDQVKEHFKQITHAEHEADLIKQSIRDNLPRSLFLPIDRWHFLEILSSADRIADRVEDLGYLLTIRRTKFPETMMPDFTALLEKALESYSKLQVTVQDFDQLIDAGFSGPVADEVLKDIDLVCHLEWETDKIGYKLSQHLFEHEADLSPIDIMMLHDIASALSKFADSVESLAKQIRRTLAR